jgi:hypothetical protein
MAEEIIFKVGVDTGDSVNKVNSVSDAVENVAKETKKTSGSFTSLRKELKDLTIQLQNLDPASKEFEKVAQRAGHIKEQMRGVSEAINDADPEVFGGKFQRTAEGIAGAFSAVTGAQALFGQQSKEIEEQMLKVQGAIALTQGISAMKGLKNDALDLATSIKGKLVGAFTSLTSAELVNAQATGTMTTLQKIYAFVVGTSTGAMKAFKIALAVSGIGAIVLLLGLAAQAMGVFGDSTDETAEKVKKLKEKQQAYKEQLQNELDLLTKLRQERKGSSTEIENNIRIMKAKGVSDKEVYEAERLLIKKQLEDLSFALGYKGSLNLEERNQKRQLKADLQVLDAEYNRKAKEEQKKTNDEAANKRKEEYKKQLEEIHQNNLKKIELENARILEQETLENEYYDSLKTQQDLEVQAVREKYNKIIETTKDNEILKLAMQKELDAVNLKYQEEKDKVESERLNNIANQYEEFVTEYSEAVNSTQQNEINAVNEKYNYLIDRAKEYGLSTIELERKRAEELKAIDGGLLEAKKKFVDEVSNLLGSLASASQQGSAIQKAFAVAQVAVDTAKSISSVIAGATAASAAGGPAAPFLLAGYVASGIATVTKAFSSVNQILKQPLPSVQPPSMNTPNNNNTNQSQQNTQQVSAQSTYKVVVVDSDISKMQEKTKKVQAISTI